LFQPAIHISGRVVHTQTIDACVEAWRSHATLHRQAGRRFDDVVGAIESYLNSLGAFAIEIPYVTNVWAAARA
jgi:hypothetical protein